MSFFKKASNASSILHSTPSILLKIAALLFLVFPVFSQDLPVSPAPKTLDQRLQERYGDPLHFDTVEKSWTDAARTPGMLLAGAILSISTIADLRSTDSCIARHTCREGNPVLGQSKAQRYGVTLPLTGLLYYVDVRYKERGHGIAGFASAYAISAAHLFAWSRNRSL